MEARIEVRSCVPHVMNHASPTPQERTGTRCGDAVREINNVICSLGSRPIRNGPKDLCRDRDGGRTSGRSRAFATRNHGTKTAPASLALPRALLPSSVPSRSSSPSCTSLAYPDSRELSTAVEALSRLLMVFERGRSDAKDERTHAGQITILPPSRQTGMFSSPRASSSPGFSSSYAVSASSR